MGKSNEIPEKYDTLKTDLNRWKKLVKSINLSQFYKLPNTIGCPDCTDGGAEWIEIRTVNKIYKVRFEYGEEIKELKGLLALIRSKN